MHLVTLDHITRLVAVEVVELDTAFETGANRDPARRVAAGTLDPLEIFGEIRFGHPPIIEGFGDLRGVVGNPVFGEPGVQRRVDEGFGLAHGVMAEGRMGVIVSGHLRIWG